MPETELQDVLSAARKWRAVVYSYSSHVPVEDTDIIVRAAEKDLAEAIDAWDKRRAEMVDIDMDEPRDQPDSGLFDGDETA